MKKKQNKNYFKFGILLLGISLLLWNCQKSEEIQEERVQILPQTKVKHISLNEFRTKEETIIIFNEISSNLDISKNLYSNKGNSNDDKIIVLTDQIIEIEKNNVTSYTFKIKNQTSESSDFENLLISKYSDNSYQLAIIKYKYNNQQENFQYNITYEKISLDDLKNSSNIKYLFAKEDAIDDCIQISYEPCSGSGDADGHEAVHPYCDGSNTILDFGGCFLSDGGGSYTDNGESTYSSSTSTSGGGSGAGATSPINETPYIWQLKNFSSGILTDDKVRTYYFSNTAIKQTVDSYLISNNFSNISQLNCNEALSFSSNIMLNSLQFNWVFYNLQSQIINDIQLFLDEEINSPETNNFAKEAFNALINGGSVDYIDRIITDPSFVKSKANCVYKLLIEQDGLKNILNKLLPENSKYVLTLKVTKDLKNQKLEKVNGLTTGNFLPYSKDILIEIDQDISETKSFPYIASIIIHEAIHAKLFEMVKSVGGLDKLSEFSKEETEFGKLWAYFDKYGIMHGWQHNFMYENYILDVANAIENFHKTHYLSDYNNFHVFVKDIAGYNKDTFYQDIARYHLRGSSKFPIDQLSTINLMAENLRDVSTAKICK